MDEALTVDKIGDVEIVLYLGDITRVKADAIVNAANSSLLGGGGVDGAIHRAAGPELDKECRKLHAEGKCPPGEARITAGGKLPAKHVIHTVGPVWQGGKMGEPGILANCYRNSIELAKRHNLGSVIFSSISTGVYGYPVEEAAQTAKTAVIAAVQEAGTLTQVGWCLFDPTTFNVYHCTWSPPKCGTGKK